MIREMLDFSRPLVLSCCKGDLRKTLEECLVIVEHQGKKRKVKVETRFTPHLPALSSDGTGLGLPIAKKIVEAHGGKLEVREAAVKGATFRVSLPV